MSIELPNQLVSGFMLELLLEHEKECSESHTQLQRLEGFIERKQRRIAALRKAVELLEAAPPSEEMP